MVHLDSVVIDWSCVDVIEHTQKSERHATADSSWGVNIHITSHHRVLLIQRLSACLLLCVFVDDGSRDCVPTERQNERGVRQKTLYTETEEVKHQRFKRKSLMTFLYLYYFMIVLTHTHFKFLSKSKQTLKYNSTKTHIWLSMIIMLTVKYVVNVHFYV